MAPPLDVCSELKDTIEQRSATIAGQGQAIITAGNEKASLLAEVERVIDEHRAFEEEVGVQRACGKKVSVAALLFSSDWLTGVAQKAFGGELLLDRLKMCLAPY